MPKGQSEFGFEVHFVPGQGNTSDIEAGKSDKRK